MPQKCVAVAMSGGVDSSVVAAILKEQCFQVIGVSMLLKLGVEVEALGNACRVAERLNIPHHMVDFRQFFKQKVIAPFCNEYMQGRTPNPCVICNHYVKLDALLKEAHKLGADYMATGHYARIESSNNTYHLLKGVDHNKDQSYFLYTLNQQQLDHLLMPLGNLYKSQVKRMAKEMGLSEILEKESRDICFIPRNDHHSFISQMVPSSPGDIVNSDEKVLGKHKGLPHYTIGQRQGLGLSVDCRLYVIRIDFANNRLVVGTQQQLAVNRFSTSRLSWVSGEAPQNTSGITAKIRYQATESGVDLHIYKDGRAEVSFAQPQQAVAPGQSIVFYSGNEVLGGGVIEDIYPQEGGKQNY
jgi:tRNA-specific 2-thiouridylase